MAEPIWVAELRIGARTAEKLTSRHNLNAEEVRDEVAARSGLRGTWDDDAERGRRAIVEIFVRGSRVLVVLYPVDHPMGDVWNLGSAYPDD